MQTVMDAAEATLRGGCLPFLQRFFRHIETSYDPNDVRVNAAAEGITSIPIATKGGRRNGTREFIRLVQGQFPDRLEVRMNNLATRVLFDEGTRAIGVECLEGQHLYRADPVWAQAPSPVQPDGQAGAPVSPLKQYFCSREVILAGGAFNTPQLLMLSGIGPKEHLEEMKVACRLDRQGVGRNLQDRYEVGVVSTMKDDFSILTGASFKPPGPDEPGDACFQEWQKGAGVYTTNGAVAAIILRSKVTRADPDLFIFGMPGAFRGYYPGYSQDIERAKNYFTWAVVKAHTNNTAGEVRLRSNDPRDTPDINFHYFDEGNDAGGEDLASVINAITFVRKMNAHNDAIRDEQVPGKGVTSQQLGSWIKDNAWGHHASCSCRMGRSDDPLAVVDSRFRVIGTQGLRIVDASVFPRIPGFFIVTPIYMISEKAAAVIAEDAT
jgi:choline dehydrogenase